LTSWFRPLQLLQHAGILAVTADEQVLGEVQLEAGHGAVDIFGYLPVEPAVILLFLLLGGDVLADAVGLHRFPVAVEHGGVHYPLASGLRTRPQLVPHLAGGAGGAGVYFAVHVQEGLRIPVVDVLHQRLRRVFRDLGQAEFSVIILRELVFRHHHPVIQDVVLPDHQLGVLHG
jgi:hypothetical protein